MTINRTTLLDLPLPVTGTESGTWGDTTNNGLTQYLDIAIAGTLVLSTDADVTLTSTEGDSSATNIGATTAQYAILRWTATGSTTRNITALAQSKTYVVINATGGTQSIVLRGAGPTTGVTIISGEKAHCVWNGSDFVKISSSAAAGGSNTQVQYNSSGVLAGSSNLTFDGTSLTLGGNPTLSAGTANGVLYLNGSKVATSGSALTFDGTALVTFTNSNGGTFSYKNTINTAGFDIGLLGGSADNTGYIYNRSSGGIVFAANNTEQMRLTSTGLGIGTSSPVDLLSLKKGNAGINLDGAGTAASKVWIDFAVPNNGGVSTSSNFAGRIYAVSSGVTNFSDNSIRIAVPVGGSSTPVDTLIVQGGNLGLGVTPSAWGSGYRSLDTYIYGSVYDSNAGNTGTASNAYYNGTNWIYKSTNPAFRFEYGPTGNTGFKFFTAPSGTAGNTISFGDPKMTLNASGQLLLGTTTALSGGNIVVGDGSGSTTIGQYLNAGTGGSSIIGRINSSNTWFVGDTVSALGSGTGMINYVYGANPWIVYTNASERARITSGGDVGIGTSSPTQKLDVAGQIKGTYLSLDDDAYLYFGDGTARIAGSGASEYLSFVTSGSERARIDSSGNLGLGGSAARATTAGSAIFNIFNGTAPVGTLTNGISLYSSSGEAYVMDAAGNATLFSPHDRDTNEWIFRSKHTPSGKVLKIDVERLLRFVNDHFGLDAVQEFIEP